MMPLSIATTPPAPELVLYSSNPGGGGGGSLLLLRLQEGRLLIIKGLEPRKRLIQDLLGRPLVSHRLLELGVLHFAVLAGTLRLHLHLCNFSFLRLNVLRQGVNRRLEVSDLGLNVSLLVRPHSSCLLVLSKVGDAEIAVLDLVGFL